MSTLAVFFAGAFCGSGITFLAMKRQIEMAKK